MGALGLGGLALGGALGLAGSVIGGDAAGREARRAREAQRDTNRKNASTQIGLANAFLGGNAGTTGQADFSDQIKQLQAIVDDQSLPLGKRKKAFKSLLKFQERNRTLGQPGLETGGLPELRQQIDAEQAKQTAEFDRTLGANGTARTSLASLLEGTRPHAEALLANADQFGPAAQRAAQLAVDQQVGQGLANVNRNAASRGLRRNPGGSSVQDAAEVGIRGDAAGGLAQALAAIEAQRAQLRGDALGTRLGLERDIAGQLGGFDITSAGQRFGLGQGYSDQRIGSYQQGLDLVRGLTSPGAIVAQPLPQGGSTTGQNIGTALSGLGGQVAGAGLAASLDRLFGRRSA